MNFTSSTFFASLQKRKTFGVSFEDTLSASYRYSKSRGLRLGFHKKRAMSLTCNASGLTCNASNSPKTSRGTFVSFGSVRSAEELESGRATIHSEGFSTPMSRLNRSTQRFSRESCGTNEYLAEKTDIIVSGSGDVLKVAEDIIRCELETEFQRLQQQNAHLQSLVKTADTMEAFLKTAHPKDLKASDINSLEKELTVMQDAMVTLAKFRNRSLA